MTDRASYSQMRLDELRSRLAGAPADATPDGLAVFCAGSYARLEASEHSDVDLFFVYGPGASDKSDKRTREIKLFSHVISVAEHMSFPAFSNDAQYLSTMKCDEILEHLGAREDDGLNLFTMRMLMLLESKSISGDAVFQEIQASVLNAYYRDYPDHQSSFEPWFLLNDIGRFWKTLLLNYENKRNQPTADTLQKNRQKVRNFKLKYSRMTTCFATIAALGSHPGTIEVEDVVDLVQKTPQERLEHVALVLTSVRSEVQEVQDRYAWFLEQTAKTEEDLRSGFEDRGHREERFRRANEYGDAMFALLTAISANSKQAQADKLLRYLVI